MCGGVLCHSCTSRCLSASPHAGMMALPRRGACLSRVDHDPDASLACARGEASGAGRSLTCTEAPHRAAVSRGIVRPGMPTTDCIGVALPALPQRHPVPHVHLWSRTTRQEPLWHPMLFPNSVGTAHHLRWTRHARPSL